MELKTFIIIFLFCSVSLGFYVLGYELGISQGLYQTGPYIERAVYDLHGAHNGTLTFLKDGTGYAYVDGMQGEFSWYMEGGISYDGLHGIIQYWGIEIPTTVFEDNLTMISPKFPDTYAVMRSS